MLTNTKQLFKFSSIIVNNNMDLSNFDFELPKSLIASRPLSPRSSAKLLFHNKSIIKDCSFLDLPDIISKKDLLVFNNTKVVPALLYGFLRKSKNVNLSKRKFEFLLVNQFNDREWFCICKPLKKVDIGNIFYFSNELSAEVIKKEEKGLVLRFQFNGNFYENLNKFGLMPIPPYIRKLRDVDFLDNEDYQSVFSNKWGSIASPTASLHFDRKLINELKGKGIKFCFVTLHIGIGTFNPIRSQNIFDHKMHTEYGEINKETANIINNSLKSGGRIIPVGTTCLRILESVMLKEKKIKPFRGYTDIYITPGYKFKIASGLITNFHLPRSSLFILVASFVGLQNAKKIYSHAIRNNYRFFSYGDGSILLK